MVVVYTVPSNKYVYPQGIGTPLDEIEIEGPPAQPQQQNSQATAQFTLHVKTAQLKNVRASITLTRSQSIAAGAAANLSPISATWGYQAVGAPAYEAKWWMVDSQSQLVAGANQVFAVQFNTGVTPGTFRFTYRVESDDLTGPVETTYDMIVL
jgi:hypothetical protein